MPLYDFRNTKTGAVREFMAPAGARSVHRDGVLWTRQPSVHRLGIVVGKRQQPTQAQEVLAGYHAQENRHGTQFRSRHSTRTIKQAWSR